MRPKHRRYTIFTDILRNKFSYMLLLPSLAFTFLFGYCTLPYFIIAFQKFNYRTGIWNSEFIGLKNFEFFFNSPKFLEVTCNTLILNFFFIFLGAILAVSFSIMLNEIRNRYFVKITQSAFLFPNFMSWIVVSYIIYALFASDFGVVNRIFEALGMQPHNWYSEPSAWKPILIATRLWKDTGMQVVIYLAAITGLDTSVNEAAKIDGANRWQIIRHITLPLLLPTVTIMVLLAIGKIFYGDFGMIYAIVKDNGVLFPTTDVIDTYVFRALRTTGNPAQATAIGMYQSLMGFICVYITNLIARKKTDGGALF